MDRFDRQERIQVDGESWDQQKLLKSKVAIVGSGVLSQNIAAALVGLGVGWLSLYDNRAAKGRDPGEFLALFRRNGHAFAADSLRDVLLHMSRDAGTGEPLLRVESTPWKFVDPASACILGAPNLIIDATNDPFAERVLLDYARARNIPLLNASAKRMHAELSLDRGSGGLEERLSPDYHGKGQHPLTAGLIAGIAADEARKVLMPLGTERPIERTVRFNGLSGNLLGVYDELAQEKYDSLDLSGMRAAVIGAGALGNWVIPGLSQMGVGSIEVWDPDVFEESNLSRQLMATLHEDAVGRGKAETVVQVLSTVFPEVQYTVRAEPFEGAFARKPDVVFRCTDNWESTRSINDAAVREGIPAVFCGTDPTVGQAYLFKPGDNYCLECMFGVDKQIAANAQPIGCTAAPDPSVITTNMVAAYLGLALFERFAAGDAVPKNIIKYDNHLISQRLHYPYTEQSPALEGSCRCRGSP